MTRNEGRIARGAERGRADKHRRSAALFNSLDAGAVEVDVSGKRSANKKGLSLRRLCRGGHGEFKSTANVFVCGFRPNIAKVIHKPRLQ